MFDSLSSFLGRRLQQKTEPLIPQYVPDGSRLRRNGSEPKPTYSKIFRWRLPATRATEPESVEIVGSFTDWQRVRLMHDHASKTWQVSLPQIVSNRTHHYMLLVDGQPAYDKTCDGLAIPSSVEEQQYQLMTDKGARVLMLFAQTK